MSSSATIDGLEHGDAAGLQAVVAASPRLRHGMLDVTVVNVTLVAIRADLDPPSPALV